MAKDIPNSTQQSNYEVQQFEGGGIREMDSSKGMYQYMPFDALDRVARRYTHGHVKYGASDNYKAGLPTGDCFDSAMRHLIAYAEGDNSEDHLAATIWNCLAMMHMEMHKRKFQTIKSRKKYRAEDVRYYPQEPPVVQIQEKKK